MSAHTPGPWVVGEGKYGNLRVEADLGNSHTWVLAVLDAAQYAPEFTRPGTQEADAKLIAAAPDLATALRNLIEACRENGLKCGAVVEAKQALRKAGVKP